MSVNMYLHVTFQIVLVRGDFPLLSTLLQSLSEIMQNLLQENPIISSSSLNYTTASN